MPDMNGLLDFAQTPMGMGLLSAAFGGLAGARQGSGPLNTIGTAGLSGIAGYSAASSNALKTQAMKLKQNQMEQLPSLYATDPGGNTTFDFKRGAALGLPAKDMMTLSQLPNASRAKVARTLDVPSANGGKQTMQYDEYGQPVGQAIDSYVAPQLVDLGGSKQFAVPTAGQTFGVSMTPGERAADARGWANVGAKQQQNSLMNDANNINKEGQRTQVVQVGDGTFMLIDKGTGEVKPATTQDGGQIKGGPLAEATVKNQQNMSKLGDLIKQSREILPNATASGFGAKVDDANRFVGRSTTGSQNAAKLAAIGGNMMFMMPRMEGPQSDKDVENYKTMAGRVGDATLPVAERMAALDAIEEIANRYSGAKPAQQPAPAAKASVVRTGKDASGRQVIQYSDGRIEYGN
ncbi:hypothetical protein [Pseudomonas sp. dw_612]|uniref:hypothetical protein n=1 Tax=Pseudomonas sp. dw_612 TaxID=2720080 RepID=UPI001BD22003|nr:hypothetical protein [Pseudomonas sp. dw_612]